MPAEPPREDPAPPGCLEHAPAATRPGGRAGRRCSQTRGHYVLDPKRLQNITILMKAVNATAEQIYAALMHGECSNKLPLMNQRIWTS